MVFKGYSRVFSTVNDMQYEAIGAFWDELSEKYGRENLRGLGFNWSGNTIEYVIGAKDGETDSRYTPNGAQYTEVELPDSGWITYQGAADKLSELYSEIYKDGALTYEIETFSDSGFCEIMIYRHR